MMEGMEVPLFRCVFVSVVSYQEGQASLLTVSLGAILRAASLPLPGDNHNEKVIWDSFRDGVNYPAVDFPKGCALLVQGSTAAIEIRSISLKMVDWGRRYFVFFPLIQLRAYNWNFGADITETSMNDAVRQGFVEGQRGDIFTSLRRRGTLDCVNERAQKLENF